MWTVEGLYWPVAEEAVLDDFDDEGSCIFLTQTRVESLPRNEERDGKWYSVYLSSLTSACSFTQPHSLKQFDGLPPEAGQACVQHECYQGHHSIHVGPDGHKELVLMLHVSHLLKRNEQLLLSHLTARYPLTHISMNHLKGVASILPPMIITISSVSLMSGSQPRFPPGELSNMKPKSGNAHEHTL